MPEGGPDRLIPDRSPQAQGENPRSAKTAGRSVKERAARGRGIRPGERMPAGTRVPPARSRGNFSLEAIPGGSLSPQPCTPGTGSLLSPQWSRECLGQLGRTMGEDKQDSSRAAGGTWGAPPGARPAAPPGSGAGRP